MKKLNSKFDAPRDIIYADLDDEVTVLFEHVRRSRHREVVIVVPVHAQVIQSLVNLKILRHKSVSLGKTLTLVTKDPVGRALAREAGLSTAERVHVRGQKVELTGISASGSLTAYRNPEISSDKPQKLGRRRLSISEAVASVKAGFTKLSRDEIPFGRLNPITSTQRFWQRLTGGITEEDTESTISRLIVRTPSRKLLFMLFGAAAILLFFVIYIAVPTATVYIVSRSDPLSKVVNVTLSESVAVSPRASAAANAIPAEFFDFELEREVRVGATGQIFEGENAHGNITIYNRSPRDKFIVPSRFLAREDIVFRTMRAVTIPRQIGDIPGSITAEVVACVRDDTKCDCINEEEACSGGFVGARGNIDSSFFTLPAIPSLSPALYWAESSEPMTGGVTKVIKFVSEEDLANAEKAAEIKINNLAKIELQRLVAQKNVTENRNLVLLENPRLIKIELLQTAVPSGIVNSLQEGFIVSVTARVSGVAYDDDLMRGLLYGQLETRVHPEKVLTKVDFDDFVYRIVEDEMANKRVKIAVTAEGVEEYDLSGATDAGARLIEKIRVRVLGKTVKEAEAYIRNLPEVDNATISSWPFWARTIPELPENVKFRDG